MDPLKVFIVEDDIITAKTLAEALSKESGLDVRVFFNGKDFLDNLHENPDVISLDYYLPDYNGSELFKRIKRFNQDIPVIIVSGQQDVSTAVDLLRKGAYDYLVKDKNMRSRLVNLIDKIAQNKQLHQKISVLEQEVEKKYLEYNIIKGNSRVMMNVFDLIGKAAKTNITVSISGETGTGKELVAKSIHYNSPRKKENFIAINVGAIPSELIESELFGHEKGSFTGATGRRIGKFEEASGGTLFLDEIGEMDLNMQVKLLRALQEEEITRIGSNEVIKIETRIIVATNLNLANEVKLGHFRKDLYFRLLGLPIELPPLRNRDNDILLLARHFADSFCEKNKFPLKRFSPKAQEKLMKYSFPGNVRELKAIIELACVLEVGDEIGESSITFTDSEPQKDFLLEEKSLEEYNNDIVKYFLVKYEGNIKLVADLLGIGKTTIYRMIKKSPELMDFQ